MQDKLFYDFDLQNDSTFVWEGVTLFKTYRLKSE
jgi:hypothetical protein